MTIDLVQAEQHRDIYIGLQVIEEATGEIGILRDFDDKIVSLEMPESDTWRTLPAARFEKNWAVPAPKVIAERALELLPA